MWGRRKKDNPEPTAAPEPFAGLRTQILDLDPVAAGMAPTRGGDEPWGCVMETAHSAGVATVVCLRDGTTSLYTTSGFGIIGGGGHAAVVDANRRLFEVLELHLGELMPSDDRSLPGEGRTVIRALTYAGARSHEADESDLGTGRDTMAPVFHAAHEVLTELRRIQEPKAGGSPA